MLEEFGPPEELDLPPSANPHGEDDEEEEELLLLHRGIPGVLGTKPLIVGESPVLLEVGVGDAVSGRQG